MLPQNHPPHKPLAPESSSKSHEKQKRESESLWAVGSATSKINNVDFVVYSSSCTSTDQRSSYCVVAYDTYRQNQILRRRNSDVQRN